jgi:hypothetical protein
MIMSRFARCFTTSNRFSSALKKHRGAGPFRNKGWVHWDDMTLLMPGRPKGVHTFHAGSSNTRSAIDNTGDARMLPLPTPPHTTTTPSQETPPAPNTLLDLLRAFSTQDTTHPLPSGGPAPLPSGSSVVNSEHISDDGYVVPPPSSSPPPLSAVSSGKRKFSALGPSDSPSGGGSSASYPSAAAKKSRSIPPRTTGPNALLQLSSRIDDFNANYRANLLQNELHAQAAYKNDKDARIREARMRAQQEKWLGPDRIAALFDIFQSTREADAYLIIEDEDLRRAWVKRKMVQVGYPIADLEFPVDGAE